MSFLVDSNFFAVDELEDKIVAIALVKGKFVLLEFGSAKLWSLFGSEV